MNTTSILLNQQAEIKAISIKKILTVIDVWYQRSNMRNTLRQLPDYRLADMGIDKEQAFIESQKPFWKS